MAVDRDIGRAFVEFARLHPVDPGIFRNARKLIDRIRPGLSSIARDLKIAIVGPDPDEVLVLGRFADRENAGVHFGGRVIYGHAARLFLFLLLGIVRGQVGRDAFPGLTVIAGAEKKLRADVDSPFLVRRSDERCVPVEAQLFLVIRFWLNKPRFESMTIDPAGETALIFRVKVVGIRRIGEGVEPVAVEDVFPLRIGNPAGIFRLANPAAVILESAIDLVGIRVIAR